MLIDKVPSNCEKKVLIECDFKSSPKCKGQYEKVYKNVLKCQANNDGKDRCQYCFNTLTKQGSDNYNFKYDKDETFFNNIDSELKAYLLGWIAGDGHIKKDGLYLSVHKKDIEITDLFRNSIAPNCKQFFRDYDNTINIRINSVKIVNDLCKSLNVNVGKKSDKITLPKLSDELLVHFIRGLMDSDGTIATLTKKSKNRSPSCSYCSMSDIIKSQIIDFCKSKNIKCSKTGYNVVWWGHNAINFLNMIYGNSKYRLTRKYDLYIDWSSWVPYHGTIKQPSRYGSKNRSSDLLSCDK